MGQPPSRSRKSAKGVCQYHQAVYRPHDAPSRGQGSNVPERCDEPVVTGRPAAEMGLVRPRGVALWLLLASG